MELLNKFKGKSVRSAILRLIVFLLIAAALLFLGGYAALQHLLGAKNIAEIPVNKLSAGQYVSIDMDYGLGLSQYSSTEKIKEGQSKGIISDYSYLTVMPDGQRYIGLRLTSEDDKALREQFIEISNGSYTVSNPPPAITFTGTLKEITGTRLSHFRKSIQEKGLDPDVVGIPLTIEHNVTGTVILPIGMAMLAIAVFFLLSGIFFLMRACAGSYQKAINKYCAETGNLETTLENLNQWFADADIIGKKLFLGPDVLLYQTGLTTQLIPVASIVWAYQRTTRTNGTATSFELVMGLESGKIKSVSFNGTIVAGALQYFEDKYPHITLGFNNELSRAFKQNPASLRKSEYTQQAPAQHIEAAPTYAITSTDDYKGPEL